MNLNLKNPVCFFDLEATGTNVARDRIIEIAMIKIKPSGETQRKTDLINPMMPIPEESTLFHGIRDSDVEGKPAFKEVARHYANFLEGTDLAGFSILKFDVPMLVEEFLRVGVEFDYQRKRIIDAQKIFHLMEKRTLSAAYRFYLDKEMEGAHSAESDAEASMHVLMAQIARYEGLDVADATGRKLGTIANDMDVLGELVSDQMVDLAGRIIKDGNGKEIFNFGKHKNKKVLDVLKAEPSYYDWMMNGDFPLDTKRKLTEIKLRGFGK